MFWEQFRDAFSQLGRNADYGECNFRIVLHVIDRAIYKSECTTEVNLRIKCKKSSINLSNFLKIIAIY